MADATFTMTRNWIVATTALMCCSLLTAGVDAAPAAADADWAVVGRQGVVRFVIVPTAAARDREAYMRQLQTLCEAGRSCFVNFYTNTTGAAVALPLPDAIDKEATVVFRRSLKQGAELFQWSCRLQMAQEPCF